MSETKALPWLKPALIGLAALAVIAAVVAAIAFLFVIPNNVESEGNKLETTLNANYANGANTLSSCTNQTVQSANVANAQSKAIKEILAAAVGGRYGNSSELDKAKLYSALQEAYPDLSGLNTLYQNVLAVITGCQIKFERAQAEVQENIRQFDAWKTGSWRVRNLGGKNFPNDTLKFNIGNTQLSGAAALDHMRKPILDENVGTAYDTGVTKNTNPFEPSSAPKPSN